MDTTFETYQEALYSEPLFKRAKVWNAVLIAGALFLGHEITSGGPLLRIVFAFVLAASFAVPSISQPKRAMFMLFTWLPFLGILRRILVPATGYSSFDPLLLVSSAVVLLAFFSLVVRGKALLDGTVLSRMVFWLLLIGVLQVFNPMQGSLLVGLTGVMFVLVPMVCFFVGRSVAEEEDVWRLQKVMIFAGVVAAAYGLYQVRVGFPGFEKAYLARAGFGGLYVGSAIRPMSIFTNPLEYSTYLGGAIMCAIAVLLYRKGIGKWWLLGIIGLMGFAGWNIGSRGFVVQGIAALIALLGLRARSAGAMLGIMAALIGGVIYFGTHSHGGQNITIDQTQSASQQLTARNQIGLLDPFNRNRSTLPQHFNGVKDGIIYAVTKQPLGMGTGATGRGARKFGTGGTSNGTELDISDAAIAFGVVGGVLYWGIIAASLIEAGRLRRWLGGHVWAAVLGFAVVALGQWLNGGNYAVAPLLWFLLGAVDAAFMRARAARKAALA